MEKETRELFSCFWLFVFILILFFGVLVPSIEHAGSEYKKRQVTHASN